MMPLTDRLMEFWTVSQDKDRVVPPEEAEKIKRELVCTDSRGYAEIRYNWEKACIYAKNKQGCETTMKTFDDFLREYDKVFAEIIEKVGAGK